MSSLMHIYYEKKDIFILDKGPRDGLDDTTLTTEKEYSIHFTKPQNKFCLTFHYNGVNNYIFANGAEIYLY